MMKMVKNIIKKIWGIRVPTEEIEIDYSSPQSVSEGLKKVGHTFEPHFINSFEEEVKELKASKERKDFENHTLEDSSFIVTEMLGVDDAKKFSMYDRDLSGDLLKRNPELYKAINGFLENGNEIEIIIPPDAPKDASVLENFKNLSSKFNLKVFELDNKSLNENSELKDIPYFSVSGDRTFRQEKRKTNREAICSFNNVVNTERLINVFAKLKQFSKPLNYKAQ